MITKLAVPALSSTAKSATEISAGIAVKVAQLISLKQLLSLCVIRTQYCVPLKPVVFAIFKVAVLKFV